MTKRPRGRMVIIDNENFSQDANNPKGNLTKRVGTRIDADCLKSVFTQLGFEVYTLETYNACRLTQRLIKYPYSINLRKLSHSMKP
jgi:hypothetical protein